MADLKETAVEKLQTHIFSLREYFVDEGAATATGADTLEYDWGTGDNGSYSYATPVRDNVFVIYDKTADFRVKRAGTAQKGKHLVGIVVGALQGKAGQVREGRVYHFHDYDVLRCKAAGAIAVGDKVSLSGAYDSSILDVHGFKVAADNTHGMGYALNSTAADGEFVAVLLLPGTYAQDPAQLA